MPKAESHRSDDNVPAEPVLQKLRIPFIRRATLTHKGGTEAAFVIDLGLLGVFVERSEPLPKGEMVALEMTLPGSEVPVRAGCRVAWWHEGDTPLASKSLPRGAGLSFVELNDADRTRLRELLEEYCRQEPSVRRFLRHWPEAERQGDDP
jgi:Tfp pilus assembly protein PilZ